MKKTGFIGFILLLGVIFLSLDISSAQASSECTSMPDQQALSTSSGGLVIAIMTQIETLLTDVGDRLFNQIRESPLYDRVVKAVLLLVVLFYGSMVVLDIKQFRPGEILMHMIKMAVIVAIASPTGWEFFSSTIGTLLWGTATEMISAFTGTSMTSVTATGGISVLSATQLAAPLASLNAAVGRTFSSHFWITVLGVFFSSKYGPIIAILLIWGSITFLMALLGALYTYIKTMVGLWFMFSMAPIFFIFLLFQRTSRLFDGWLAMMVGMVLELVLLFSFLAFFVVVVTASLQNILLVEWCKEPVKFLGLTVWNWWVPRYANAGQTPVDPTADTFPLELIDVMFFILSSYITWQYTQFVSQISHELSSSGLRMGGAGEAMRNYFRTRGWGGDQLLAQGAGWASRKFR